MTARRRLLSYCGAAAVSEPHYQLVLPLPLDDQYRLDNFIAVEDSRRAALAALNHREPVVLLVAAPQSGLSHLLQAVAAGSGCIYLPLAELASYSPAAVLDGLEQQSTILLDDIDAVWQQPAWAEALFSLYNRCRDSGVGWVAASHTALGEQSPPLADLRSRLGSGLLFHWPAYSDDQLAELLTQRAARRGLTLSGELTRYLLSRLSRNPAALVEALELLDHHSLTTGRALTIPLAKQALAL